MYMEQGGLEVRCAAIADTEGLMEMGSIGQKQIARSLVASCKMVIHVFFVSSFRQHVSLSGFFGLYLLHHFLVASD